MEEQRAPVKASTARAIQRRQPRERRRLFEEVGAPALETIDALNGRLDGLDAEVRERFLLSPEDSQRLLEALGAELLALYDAELEAAGQLRSALG